MKKLLILGFLLLIHFATRAQMEPGEYFTGDFRLNPACIYEYEGFTNFSVWKCIYPIDLPVTLTEFKAQEIAPGNVQLIWRYTNPVQHDFFIVEHSTDGHTWKEIGQTTGRTFRHKTAAPLNYYRLGSMDKNGDRNLYQIIALERSPAALSPYYDIFGRVINQPPPGVPFIKNGILQVIIK